MKTGARTAKRQANKEIANANEANERIKDLFFASTRAFPAEHNDRALRNSLLFPISKAFLEEHPQYSDQVRSYEAAVEAIPGMIENDKESIIDTYLSINEHKVMHLKINISNPRLYGPNTIEAINYAGSQNMLTPKLALAKQASYLLWLVGDISYSFIVIDKRNVGETNDYAEELNAYVQMLDENKYIKGVVRDGYIAGIPLMLGSKWCALRNFDYGTLILSGDDMIGFYGCFVIEGYLRYLIPCMKKPINKTITLHNEFDAQLSRVEVPYSKNTQDFQNSYYTVGSMLQPASITSEDITSSVSCHEFGISMQLNHQTMNVIAKGKSSKELINFVPAKLLFAAFGCCDDKTMLDYVCPDHRDIGLMTTLKTSCLYGPKLHDAFVKAGIKLVPTDQGYIKLAEPLTMQLARYVIGILIMKEEVLSTLRLKSHDSVNEFRFLVEKNVDTILAERFMPAIGDKESGSNVERNSAVCVTLGNLFRRLYNVGIDARNQDSKQSLVNKRFFCGQSFIKEFKAFHGFRLNQELVPAVQQVLSSCDRSDFASIIEGVFQQMSKQISQNQTRSMITSFKASDKNESKFQNDLVEPKNQLFIWNKLREVRKNPQSKQRDIRENWDNRRDHPSEFSFMCPSESPDSCNVGKFRALGVHSRVTTLSSQKPILEILNKNPKFKRSISGDEISVYYTVSINGSIVGYLHQYDDVESTYDSLMKMRRNELPHDLTIVLNHILGDLSIWCDSGRLTTPFVIVDNCFDVEEKRVIVKKDFLDWLDKCNEETGHFYEGIKKGFIEFMDSEMLSENAVLAGCIRDFYEEPSKFTHISLSASIDGIIMAANPCANLNGGIKSGMSTNHIKQAMGYPISKYPQLTFMNSMDILVGAQQQMIQPAIYRFLGLDKVPIGQNVTICFCQFKYNQDDSVIFNRESVENGLLKCDTFTTFKSNTLKNDEEFSVPNKGVVESLVANPFSYDKIGEGSCLPKEISSVFYTNDVLIGKVKRTDVGFGDISEINKMPDASDTINPRPMRCVEKLSIHERDAHSKMLTTGQYRVLIPGDKTNLEQGQKNTAGKIIDPECLPYTSTGRRADVYFNPLSILKRKTYGCLYLATMMKIAALYGCILENSSYGTCRTVDEIVELFDNMKLDNRGFETMYDPETGNEIKNNLFFGMAYYERQHHLVESKINVRCKGGRESTYMMPKRGRRVNGGLTVDGKLSLNALNSSGANFLIKDFHLKQCSQMEIGFCEICHSVMCYKEMNADGTSPWTCPCCGKHPRIIPRLVSCSFPLLQHIFAGLHLELIYYSNSDKDSDDEYEEESD